MVTVVGSVRAPASSVAVTPTGVAPSPSDNRGGCAVRAMLDDVASSSASSTSAPVTGRTDVPVTNSISSDSSTSSSVGVSVKVPVPRLSPAAMVMVNEGTGSKSTASAFPVPATATVTVVASVRALASSVAVTRTALAPPSSAIRRGLAESSMAAEGWSSSASSTVSAVTGRTEVPSTDSISSCSSTSSSSGVSVNVPVPLVSPAEIVMVKSSTSAKSTASAFPLPATEIVTVVGSVRAPASSIAVTTTGVAPASSRTRSGAAVSSISADVTSLSRIVPSACPSPIVAFVALVRLTKSFSSDSSTMSSTTATVIVRSVSVDVKVSVPIVEP